MSELKKNSTRYLQKQYPHATVLSEEFKIRNIKDGTVTKVTYLMIAQDWQTGVKQRLIAVPNLGSDKEVSAIAKGVESIFKKTRYLHVYCSLRY